MLNMYNASCYMPSYNLLINVHVLVQQLLNLICFRNKLPSVSMEDLGWLQHPPDHVIGYRVVAIIFYYNKIIVNHVLRSFSVLNNIQVLYSFWIQWNNDSRLPIQKCVTIII